MATLKNREARSNLEDDGCGGASARDGHTPRRVAILVDTGSGWGRRLLQGVQRYVRTTQPWDIWVQETGPNERMVLPRSWHGDGIIARLSSHEVAGRVTDAGLPVVNVSGIELDGVDVPRVTVSYQASAKTAFEHLSERGLKRFAYFGPLELPYVKAHHEAYRDVIASHRFELESYDWGPRTKTLDEDMNIGAIAEWLTSLVHPVGIVSWGVLGNKYLIEACRRAGLAVPEDVAVLGSDDDEILNDLITPPVSGVLVPSEQIGFEAACLLSKLMEGATPDPTQFYLEPFGVQTRASTDVLAVEDTVVAAAMRYIKQHARSPIQVTDILRHVPVSRRVLERRFKAMLGRTPAEELRRVRLSIAADLLVDSQFSITEVASRSGFEAPQHMARLFRRHFGVTPLAYRKRAIGKEG